MVDPGTYTNFVVDGNDPSSVSSVSILAASGSFTLTPVPGAPEIIVRDVPAGSVVTIIGVQISYADPLAPAVLVIDNAGAVRLSELDVQRAGNVIGSTAQACVEVQNTATFWLIDSSIWSATDWAGSTFNPRLAGGISNDGFSALQFVDSKGVVQNSRLRGYYNCNTFSPTGYGGDGLRAVGTNTSVWLLEDNVSAAFATTCRGGDGNYGGNAVHQFRTPTDKNRIQVLNTRIPVDVMELKASTPAGLEGSCDVFGLAGSTSAEHPRFEILLRQQE